MYKNECLPSLDAKRQFFNTVTGKQSICLSQ